MRKYLFIALLIALFGCKEKNEKNSKYREQISDLKSSMQDIDSVYSIFEQYNVDSLVSIRENSDKKHKKVKSVYKSDSLDTNYETIMMIVRGKFVKGLKSVTSVHKQINEEYKLSTNQISTLNKHLIYETLEKDSALIYYNLEKMALIKFKAQLIDFIKNTKYTLENYPIYIAKLDSIISVHENQ